MTDQKRKYHKGSHFEIYLCNVVRRNLLYGDRLAPQLCKDEIDIFFICSIYFPP